LELNFSISKNVLQRTYEFETKKLEFESMYNILQRLASGTCIEPILFLVIYDMHALKLV
jgi:hypothetical protein